MPDQPSEPVHAAIAQLRAILETLDTANEHVAAALIADALGRLEGKSGAPSDGGGAFDGK